MDLTNDAGIVICDLDGCLSDDRWRRCLLPKEILTSERSYDNYHSHCARDSAVDDVLIELLHDLRGSNDAESAQKHHLLIVTARPEKFRSQTELWLRETLPGINCTVLMRPNDCAMRSAPLKLFLLSQWLFTECGTVEVGWSRVVAAYDDREDVLNAYLLPRHKLKLRVLLSGPGIAPELPPATTAHGLLAKAEAALRNRDAINAVPAILQSMASTFAERNKVYGSNYKNVAPIIKALWPQGVPSSLVTTEHWHLFELMVVKMTRFANSGLTHVDSVHDMAVYAAMIESIISREENEEDADGQC